MFENTSKLLVLVEDDDDKGEEEEGARLNMYMRLHDYILHTTHLCVCVWNRKSNEMHLAVLLYSVYIDTDDGWWC